MKSAYERAMEKFGEDVGNFKEYTEQQKEQLAEVDRKYDTKIAEARLAAESSYGETATGSEDEQNLQTEIASLEEKRRQEKDHLRKQFDEENT